MKYYIPVLSAILTLVPIADARIWMQANYSTDGPGQGMTIEVYVFSDDALPWQRWIVNETPQTGELSCGSTFPAAGDLGGCYVPSGDVVHLWSESIFTLPTPGVQHVFEFYVYDEGLVTLSLYDESYEIVDTIVFSIMDVSFIMTSADGPYTLALGETILLDGSHSLGYGLTSGIQRYDWYVGNTLIGSGETLSLSYDEITNTHGLEPGSHQLMLSVYGSSDYGDYPVEGIDITSLLILPELQIQYPNGGEEFFTGTTCQLSWTNTGTIETIQIEYSIDNGNEWTVVDTVPNTGSYDWLVPEEQSQQCLLRISDPSSNATTDITDMAFTIYECALLADMTSDCLVNLEDVMVLASYWLQCSDPWNPYCSPSRLVGHWSFDYDSGDTVYDVSSNGNDGIALGDPNWVAGIVGDYAIELDGVDDYVDISEASALDFAPNSFSVSAWIKPREVIDGWRTILEYNRAGTNWFGLWLNDAGGFHFRVGSNKQDSDQQLNPDQWYFLTAVYDSADSKMTMYINGTFDSFATHSSGFTAPSASRLTIGAYGYEGLENDTLDEFFDGVIDEVRIYDRALSEGEIELLVY